MADLPITYIQANSNRYKDLTGQPARPWNLIVIHDMEAPETNKTAQNVASWFHSEATPQTSAHYCVDSEHIVQCVQLRDVAYAAPNANRNGIHIELSGYAKQTKDQWLDEFGIDMMANAAKLIATVIIPKTGIPVDWLIASDLAQGKRGITTHAQVSKWSAAAGLPGDHSHTDPGDNFPIHEFMQMIRLYMPSS